MASIPIPRHYRTVIYIPSRSDGSMLEVCLSIPTNISSQPQGYTGVIIAHPYGPLGGSYNNNIVGALLQWFETYPLHVMGEDPSSNVPRSPSKKSNESGSNLRQQNPGDDGKDSSAADSSWVLLKSPKKNASKDQAMPLSCVVCALNFRGCGKSKGRTSWFGEAEREDYQTIVDFLQSGSRLGGSHFERGDTPSVWSGKVYDETGQEIESPRIPSLSRFILIVGVYMGYSYGGMIASTIPPPLRNPSDPTSEHLPTSYILISYPAGVAWFLTSGSHGSFSKRARAILLSETDSSASPPDSHLEGESVKSKKKRPIKAFFITGSQDQFTSPKTLVSWLKTNAGLNPPKQLPSSGSWALNHPDGIVHLDVVEGADHFWLDRELLLLEKLQSWWTEAYQ
ncbi:hypothetical protein BGZ80_004984 [Entomortierella chlamydospora]|uniref:Uncharacterized protein n=1 Tax=Entomortierella chlamydospora TaxID=101097 RepID=A0A9P6N005_9FUNG|nr:hypothetical protein BGZ79_010730 [Entomortierella chlamydospora]KAG0019966.1 hypothetical protein BGZ80_004984 [Entomortierella chlamydospora]